MKDVQYASYCCFWMIHVHDAIEMSGISIDLDIVRRVHVHLDNSRVCHRLSRNRATSWLARTDKPPRIYESHHFWHMRVCVWIWCVSVCVFLHVWLLYKMPFHSWPDKIEPKYTSKTVKGYQLPPKKTNDQKKTKKTSKPHAGMTLKFSVIAKY